MHGYLARTKVEGRPVGTPDTTLQTGDLIDERYRVNSLLGVGGMATVWSGTNERTGKRVALKVIRRDLTSMPGAELLFHLEALAVNLEDKKRE